MDPGGHCSNDSDSGRGKQRRPVVRHARSSTRVLKEWYAAHSSWPYLADQEKESLSDRTGLTIRQVSYWFVNARRRNGDKLSSSAPATTNNSLGSLSAIPPLSKDHDWSNMNPLERWRNSPPEQEPAPIQAISNAVQMSIDAFAKTTDRIENSFDIPVSNGSRPSSIDSLDFATSGGSSDSSAHSYKSDSILNFSNQITPWSKRRRPRKAVSRRIAKSQQIKETRDDRERISQCTFCTDAFKSRYDWTRHEETLHLALETWICLPFGPTYVNSEAQIECALCGAPNPSDAHFKSHQAFRCTGKLIDTRTFRRKDHLRQHLRLVHGVQEMPSSMRNWRSKVSQVKSRCGFCGETFSLWSDRNDHLSDHFKAGVLMKDWKGCRGLEPAVALLVENAIPPYLIGTVAKDAEPFSASNKNTQSGFAAGGSSPAPTAFGALTADLGDYVRTERLAGNHVTDDALRSQARRILYGDDDPWDQTPADNTEWLEMFKAGYGLDCDPLQQLETAGCASNAFSGSAEPLTSLHSLGAGNFGPFTAEAVQQAVGFDQAMMQFELNFAAGTGHNGVALAEPTFTIPWSWQTPECLAEFRQLGLPPGMSGACDPMVGEASGLAPGCLHTKPAVSDVACSGGLPKLGQAFTTPQNNTLAATAQTSGSGTEPPPKFPPNDTLLAFDTEFDFAWLGN